MALDGIVQLFSWKGLSRALVARGGPSTGLVLVSNGRVVHAECGSLQGVEAFAQLLSWVDVYFDVGPLNGVHPTTIECSTDMLMLQCAPGGDDGEDVSLKIDDLDFESDGWFDDGTEEVPANVVAEVRTAPTPPAQRNLSPAPSRPGTQPISRSMPALDDATMPSLPSDVIQAAQATADQVMAQQASPAPVTVAEGGHRWLDDLIVRFYDGVPGAKRVALYTHEGRRLGAMPASAPAEGGLLPRYLSVARLSTRCGLKRLGDMMIRSSAQVIFFVPVGPAPWLLHVICEVGTPYGLVLGQARVLSEALHARLDRRRADRR